jgi:hypothetical protein
MKILDFFLFLWVIFVLLDPDPQFECGSGSSNSNYADPCGSGSRQNHKSKNIFLRVWESNSGRRHDTRIRYRTVFYHCSTALDEKS